MEDIQEVYETLTEILTNDELFNKKIEQLFSSLDINLDKKLEPSELEKLVDQLCIAIDLKAKPAKDRLMSAYEKFAQNKGTSLTKEELVPCVRSLLEEERQECAKYLDI